MRSLTGQDTAVLNAQDGYSVYARVFVWTGSAWQNVSSLEDRDWLVSVEWNEGINEPCAQAKVMLRRQLEDFSLNPLVSNKLTGVLALARPFYVEAATCPLGDPPQSDEWREVFRGQIEELDLEKDPLTFTGRDQAGVLLRTYIETQREYGGTTPVSVESIIQSILTDNGTGVTLYTPVATGVVRGKYTVKKGPLLAAVREQALLIGWDVRYLWDSGTGAFRFTLIKPDRTAATSNWTFGTHQRGRPTRLAQELYDVRNAVRVFYYDRSTLTPAGKATLTSVLAEDATSVTTYGRMYMQLAEGEDSPIDSASEAQVLANAARDDLKDPLLNYAIPVGFHYGVQLGDMLTFPADDEHFSSDQMLAVVSAAHRIGVRGHGSLFTLRGKPVGAQAAYLNREGRVSPQPPAATPSTVSSLAATATSGGGVITFTPSLVPPIPSEYELHVSTSSGFAATSATFRERATRTTFEVTGLSPGVTHYAKIVGIDRAGNRSSVSAEASFVPRYIAPFDLQPVVVFNSLNPNPSFEAWTLGDSLPPDTWSMSAGTWGVDVSRTTTADSGGYALVFPATTSGEKTLISQFISVTPGMLYAIDARYYRPSGVFGDGAGIHMEIRWYTSTFAEVSTGSRLIVEGESFGTWASAFGAKAAPATARYARFLVGRTFGPSETYVDHAFFRQYTAAQENWKNAALLNSFLSFGTGYATPGYYLSTDGRVYLRGVVKRASAPALGTPIFSLPSGYIPSFNEGPFVVSADGGTGFVKVQSSGDVLYDGGSTVALSLGSISFRLA